MKLTGKNKFIGGIAIAGALAVTGLVGFAQQRSTQEQGSTERVEGKWGRGHRGGHGMKRGFFGGRFAEKLNLTDAQKEQMKQIATRYHESNKASREQSRGKGGHNFGSFDGGTFNESAVRAAAQERANKQVEREVARARMMSEMYAILTPEQKAQLAAERQQMEQKRQERRARRGATSDQIQ
jgi:Spy/CpxP family protein refolding chaperone